MSGKLEADFTFSRHVDPYLDLMEAVGFAENVNQVFARVEARLDALERRVTPDPDVTGSVTTGDISGYVSPEPCCTEHATAGVEETGSSNRSDANPTSVQSIGPEGTGSLVERALDEYWAAADAHFTKNPLSNQRAAGLDGMTAAIRAVADELHKRGWYNASDWLRRKLEDR